MSYALVEVSEIDFSILREIAVGSEIPVFNPEYRGWETGLGIISDPHKALCVIGEPQRAVLPTVTIQVFWSLFSAAEWSEAQELSKVNSQLSIMLGRLDDPRTTHVSLDTYSVEISHVVHALTTIPLAEKSHRLNQILSAEPI